MFYITWDLRNQYCCSTYFKVNIAKKGKHLLKLLKYTIKI